MKQLKVFCDRCKNEVKTRRRIDIQDYVEVVGYRSLGKDYMTHTFKSTIRMEICDDCYEKILAFLGLCGGDSDGEPTKQL